MSVMTKTTKSLDLGRIAGIEVPLANVAEHPTKVNRPNRLARSNKFLERPDGPNVIPYIVFKRSK
jgi:hypothetical protein